jgi:thiaminase
MVQSTKRFSRTLQDLDNLANSEFIKGKKFEDFSVADLKKMKSQDYRQLCAKKIEEFSDKYLKTREKIPNEEVVRFEQSEVKNLTKALTNFRDQCEKDGLSVKEFEEESVNFITDKYKRFFFNSKWAQRLYKINNSIASTSLGYWGYRAVGVLGTTNRFLLQTELSKSFLPIAYFTGVTCRFWAYITSPLPPVSKVFDGISHVAMSPIWLLEYLINKVTGPIFRATPLKTEIPLNVTGEVAAGTGLTWEKLTHTFEFVKNMTENWEIQ